MSFLLKAFSQCCSVLIRTFYMRVAAKMRVNIFFCWYAGWFLRVLTVQWQIPWWVSVTGIWTPQYTSSFWGARHSSVSRALLVSSCLHIVSFGSEPSGMKSAGTKCWGVPWNIPKCYSVTMDFAWYFRCWCFPTLRRYQIYRYISSLGHGWSR